MYYEQVIDLICIQLRHTVFLKKKKEEDLEEEEEDKKSI
jgi:hypothetical protein